MSIFNSLENRNEFPMLFIGSGISRRYLKGFPSWMELLESFWNECNMHGDFYGSYNNKLSVLEKEKPHLSEKERNFNANIQLGSMIHDEYNRKFNLGEIRIKDFTPKDAHFLKVSPFKYALAQKFTNYEINRNKEDEIKKFVEVLNKASIIITTNYDEFIENEFKKYNGENLDIFIGQNGFFTSTEGTAELYKIHGSVKEPHSIIIDETDYNDFDRNSVLITAKIISHLIHSPIIFLGYSLTDENVRKFIKDFSRSIKETDFINLEERLIIVERDQNEPEIIEKVIDDRELGCRFTYIKTANFSLVFEKLSKVNQGVSPLEIRKYKKTIRTLIEDAGKKQALKSVLVSSTTLDEIQQMIKQGDFKNIAVAIGDARVIFQIPDSVSYMYSYITDDDSLVTDVALRFLFGQRIGTYLPFKKFITEDILTSAQINIDMKDKLRRRAENHSDVNVVLNNIVSSNQLQRDSLQEIVNEFYTDYINKCYDVICYNFDKFEISEIKLFITRELEMLVSEQKPSVPTALRKLIVVYDLKTNSH